MDLFRKLKLISASSWLVVPIYVFGVLIPMSYTVFSRIPDHDSLINQDGVLISHKLLKGDSKIGLKTLDGNLYFTCRASFGLNHKCLSKERAELMVGRSAEVWWFEQKIYPFFTQRRLVRLVVDGEEIIGAAKTLELQRSAANTSLLFAVVLFIFNAWVIFYYESKVRRISKNNGGKTTI